MSRLDKKNLIKKKPKLYFYHHISEKKTRNKKNIGNLDIIVNPIVFEKSDFKILKEASTKPIKTFISNDFNKLPKLTLKKEDSKLDFLTVKQKFK